MVDRRFRFYAALLCAAIIVVFFLQTLIPQITNFLVLDQSSYSEPWRFVSAMFVHGGLLHLVLNIFALAFFGSILEYLIGGKKFLLVFFVGGILANLVAVNFYNASLGASGAIYGVIGALVIIRPLMVVWAFGLPMPMVVAGMLWVVGDTIGIFMPSNVGNIAHLSGMAVGLIFGVIYRGSARVQTKSNSGIRINESEISRWENAHLK